jgi:hypothetical protein
VLLWAGAGIVLAAAGFCWLVSWRSPNRHPQRHLSEAQTHAKRGALAYEAPASALRPQRSWLWRLQAGLWLLVLPGLVLLLTPTLVRWHHGWRLNGSSVTPRLVEPGTWVRIWVPTPINSARGHHRQQLVARADNWQALGLPRADLDELSNHNDWNPAAPDESAAPCSVRPWTDVLIPDDPQLAQRDLMVRLSGEISYPTARHDSNYLATTTTRVDDAIVIRVSPRKASRAYNRICLQCFAMSAVLLLTASCGLGLVLYLRYGRPSRRELFVDRGPQSCADSGSLRHASAGG